MTLIGRLISIPLDQVHGYANGGRFPLGDRRTRGWSVLRSPSRRLLHNSLLVSLASLLASLSKCTTFIVRIRNSPSVASNVLKILARIVGLPGDVQGLGGQRARATPRLGSLASNCADISCTAGSLAIDRIDRAHPLSQSLVPA